MERIIMSTDALEQRLSAVETAIAELKQQTVPAANQSHCQKSETKKVGCWMWGNI
jgi:hypothetical protein